MAAMINTRLKGSAWTVLSQALDRIQDGSGLASFDGYEHECLVDALDVLGNLIDACGDGEGLPGVVFDALLSCGDLFEASL